MTIHTHSVALLLGAIVALVTVGFKLHALLTKHDGRSGLRIMVILAAGVLGIWWLIAALELVRHGEIDVLVTVPAMVVLLMAEIFHSTLGW